MKKKADKIIPVIKHRHWMLVTLVICNAAATETLPLFLHLIIPSWAAVLISVFAIFFFGEIIPLSLFSGKYQLIIA